MGKTTLAHAFATRRGGAVHHFDLENPDDLARLREPMLALAGLRGLVVLDEVQRVAEIFPVLRVLADRPELPARFLVLGSASPELWRQTSESLAGRIVSHVLGGLALDEVGVEERHRLWLRGGFPRSYLAPDEPVSFEWRRAFVQTFLERDLPQLGVQVPATTLRRFWTMIAHYHAQLWNGAELARAFGMSESSVRRYLDVLTAALVLRQLPPGTRTSASGRSARPRSTSRTAASSTPSSASKTARPWSATPRSAPPGSTGRPRAGAAGRGARGGADVPPGGEGAGGGGGAGARGPALDSSP